jgi:hypothetical protein
VTEQLLARYRSDWQSYAGKNEPITVENVGGTVYAFGSELATMRIMKVYRFNQNVRHGWSENLQSWYVSMEPTLF